jgi:hypothetical protein
LGAGFAAALLVVFFSVVFFSVVFVDFVAISVAPLLDAGSVTSASLGHPRERSDLK